MCVCVIRWCRHLCYCLPFISLTLHSRAQLSQADLDTNDTCPAAVTVAEVDAEEASGSSEYLHDCYCYRLGSGVFTQNRVDCDGWVREFALGRALTLLSVFTIVTVNFALKWILFKLGQFEKHDTVSKEQSSIMIRTFFGMFINTALILLLVNANMTNALGGNAHIGFLFQGGELV
jgi:hypothetical protein